MEVSQAAVGISSFELKWDVRSNRTESGKALEKCQELIKVMPCLKKTMVASKWAVGNTLLGTWPESSYWIELGLSIYPMKKKRSTFISARDWDWKNLCPDIGIGISIHPMENTWSTYFRAKDWDWKNLMPLQRRTDDNNNLSFTLRRSKFDSYDYITVL